LCYIYTKVPSLAHLGSDVAFTDVNTIPMEAKSSQSKKLKLNYLCRHFFSISYF